MVFDGEEHHAEVDADDIGVVPVTGGARLESLQIPSATLSPPVRVAIRSDS